MAAQKKTEAKATETKAEVTKTSLMDKIKNSRPVKYLKVHGKDLLIGAGIGVSVYKLVKNHKAAQLEAEIPSTEEDFYQSEVTSSDKAAPTEE